MTIEPAVWRGLAVPFTPRSTYLRQLFTRCCLLSAAILCLFAFQHKAAAQTVTTQCTNPVCKPGRPCALLRCPIPRPCLDCAPPPSSGSGCVVGYALGNDADFAGGDVPDVLIESTDYWTIDDYGNVYYDGSSTTGPVMKPPKVRQVCLFQIVSTEGFTQMTVPIFVPMLPQNRAQFRLHG